MNLPSEQNGITYEILDAARGAEAGAMIAETFSRDEPLAVAAGQTAGEFVAMLDIFIPVALPENLSVCAIDDGDVVGVALATRFTTVPPPEIADATPHYPPIGAIIEALEAGYEATNADTLQTCLHLHMLAVSQEARGRGIAGTLVDLCAANGSASGFATMVADATNPASQRVFARCGFAEIARIDYNSFTFEGSRTFASAADAGGIALVEKRL